MAGKGGPEGNTNSSRQNRLVRDTLRRIAVQNPERLRKACEVLLENAEKGDISAFREFRDTLDGKPIQSTEVTLTKGNSAERLADDELADIATGSSHRTPEEKEGEKALH